jgi:4-amino-4-deoxy-L-arabinose transferase-like glycosyltransferase
LDDRAHVVTSSHPASGQSGAPPQASGWTKLAPFGLAILIVAELAWLAWFLIVPLPNANSVRLPNAAAVRRGWILLKTFPEVVPDTPLRESFLGQAIEELSHVENLPQRGSILLAACLIAAAAAGLGDLVLRGLRLERGLGVLERVALDYGLGAGLLGAIALIAGRLGCLTPWSCRVALGLVAIGGFVRSGLGRAPQPKLDSSSYLFGLVIAPFVVLMILGSMLPSIDFDALEYHLQGPKEYFQAGRIAFLPHNVYTNMPFGVEMLHLLGMEVLNDWWWGALVGQLLIALFAPATAILIAGVAARAGSTRAGWMAVVVYLTTPWVYRLAAIAYVEGPLFFYHAAMIWAVVRGGGDGTTPARRPWGLLGLLAGCAMGCKYPALISAAIPFGILAVLDSWRGRSVVPVEHYLLGWAVVMGPWLGKNFIDTGNPVYPLANSVFHGRYWDQARETQWTTAHGRGRINAREFWTSVVDVAGRSDWQSPLYVALAPLALLRPGSRRLAVALWGYAAYLFLTWWLLTHRVDRFWLPMLPPLAILAGLGADWSPRRGWTIVLGMILTIAIVTNLAYVSTALAALNEWTGDLVFLRRDIPERWNPPLARLDTELPKNARPLLVGQAAVFHLNHAVTYNTVFNPETIELLASGKTPEEFRRALHERGLTHVYVDWKEIQRHRLPGHYGFTDFVTHDRFAQWVAAGVLESPSLLGPEQQLYRIR